MKKQAFLMRPLLDGIVPALVEGVASADSPESFERADECPAFLDGLNEVIAAGGLEAALSPDQGREAPLVDPDECYQPPPRQADRGAIAGVSLFGPSGTG